MAIIRKYTEVDDGCLGPEKKNNHWEMFLFISLCVEYSRKTKIGLKKYTRKVKTVKQLTGITKKDVLKKLDDYIKQENVELLVA